MKFITRFSIILGLILSVSAAFAGEYKCSTADGSAQGTFKFDAKGNVTNYTIIFKARAADALNALEDFAVSGGNGFDAQVVYPDGEDVVFSAYARDKVSTDANGTVHFNGHVSVFSDGPMTSTPAACTYTPDAATTEALNRVVTKA